MFQQPATGITLDLPADVWDAILGYLVRAHQQGNAEQHRVQRNIARDFARLAWTFRDAYLHVRPHLWATLRLVFQSEKPKYLNAGPVLLARHQEVVAQSVFPDYETNRSRQATSLTRHIARRTTVPLLARFVVLGGKLFLASFVRGEPNFAGIRSLWGADVDTRRIGQLDLVEYPMHLVKKVVIDLTDSCVKVDPKFIRNKLPFLFSLGHKQVTSLTLLATNPGAAVAALHQAMCQHHLELVHYDYAIKSSGSGTRPLVFPERARALHMYTDRAIDAGDALCHVRRMVDVEFRGAGGFSVRGWAKAAGQDHVFALPTVRRLVLDYDTPIDLIETRHLPLAFSFSSLTSLTITLDLAGTLFPRIRSTAPTPRAFPQLTHLTILGTRPVTRWTRSLPNLDEPVQVQWLPRLPYVHMPHLYSLSLPANHRGSPNTTQVGFVELRDMLATGAASIAHVAFPGLRGISVARTVPLPVQIESGVQSAWVRASHAGVLGSRFAFPRLQYLRVIVDARIEEMWAMFKDAQALTKVVVQLQATGAGADAGSGKLWDCLAQWARQVQEVIVVGGHDMEMVEGMPIEELADPPMMLPEGEFGSDDDEDDEDDAAALAALPTVSHRLSVVTLVLMHPTPPPPRLLPAFTDLIDVTIHCNQLSSFLPVLPQLDHLVIHGRPRTALAWQYMLNLVSPACRVEILAGQLADGGVNPRGTKRGISLTLRYAGQEHGSIWRNLRKWGALVDGAIGTVRVQVMDVVEEGEARMVGEVLMTMLAAHTGRVKLYVVWPGAGNGHTFVTRMRMAILDMSVGVVHWV